MHVTLGQATLARALTLVTPVAADSPADPRLDRVCLRAEGSLIELAATDLTASLRVCLPAVVWEAGAITVPARLLQNLVSSLLGGEVVLMVDDRHQLTIRAGRTRSTLAGGDPDDIPALAAADDLAPIAQLEGRELQDLIAGVIVASRTEADSRPVLAAVRVEFAPLTLVACDGVRLALRRRGGAAPAHGAQTDPPGVTVPRRALVHLARLLRQEQGALTLAHDPGRVLLGASTASGATWTARLIEGDYPDYRVLIPATTATTITVERSALRLALRRGATFDPVGRLVRLAAHPATGGGSLTVTAQGQETGETTSELTATVVGAPVSLWLDAGLLDGLLGAIDAPEVALGLRGSTTPCLVRPAGRDDHLALLMPCQPGSSNAVAADDGPAGAVSEDPGSMMAASAGARG